ncbi:MAG TPA: hypothetical protein VMQ50_17230, partial [Casimicrobiaceae bacterium]|nr:hypothetical protein [Casimicrobiaceae bacterium]
KQRIVGLRPVFYLPSLAVMKKDLYVPYLFSSSEFTMSYTQAGAALQNLSVGQVLPNHLSPKWDAIVSNYDYFFLVDAQQLDTPIPKQLVQVFQGRTISVYKR